MGEGGARISTTISFWQGGRPEEKERFFCGERQKILPRKKARQKRGEKGFLQGRKEKGKGGEYRLSGVGGQRKVLQSLSKEKKGALFPQEKGG